MGAIREQYELLNLSRIETAKTGKLCRKLDRELLQLNTSFTVISRETVMLTYKKIILNMLQHRQKIAVLRDGLTQIQLDIKHVSSYIELYLQGLLIQH